MDISNIFYNSVGRLRSGWRFSIFIVACWLMTWLLGALLILSLNLIFGLRTEALLATNLGWIVQAAVLFIPAALVGWACGKLFEGLPWRALGWALHHGWLRDWLMGSLVGASSLLLAALVASLRGGFRFSYLAAGRLSNVFKTLLISGLIFMLAAAAEEVLFRGYALQTMTRARLAWVGLLLTSALFASVHLGNPNVVPGFTFINTALAGVWLGVAYLRTRSLWFPLGIHWSWNWTMGAILGLPVSGIESLAPAPLLHAVDAGPVWLTGGAYGIEGGAACTLALALSTLFIWRTRLLNATYEMRQFTDEENPQPDRLPLKSRPNAHTSEPAPALKQPPV